jgi:hypothetical protein
MKLFRRLSGPSRRRMAQRTYPGAVVPVARGRAQVVTNAASQPATRGEARPGLARGTVDEEAPALVRGSVAALYR